MLERRTCAAYSVLGNENRAEVFVRAVDELNIFQRNGQEARPS